MRALDVASSSWELRSAGRRQRVCQLLSLFLHIAVLSVILLAGTVTPHGQTPASGRVLTMLYVPPKAAKKPPAVQHGKTFAAEPVRVAGANIDLAGIHLAIRDDPTFELIAVLGRYHGFLGFADPRERRYITRLFQAPEWRPWGHGWAAVDGFFAVDIAEPEKWAVVRTLRNSNHIPTGPVYALFPLSIRASIDTAIQQAAAHQTQHGHVSAALIAFSRENLAGFVVEHVTIERLP